MAIWILPWKRPRSSWMGSFDATMVMPSCGGTTVRLVLFQLPIRIWLTLRLSSLYLRQLKDHWHRRVWSWYTLLNPKLRPEHMELNFVYLSRIRTNIFHPILNLLELDLAFPSSCHASCHLLLLDLGLLLRRIYRNTTINMSRAVQKWSSCLSRPHSNVLLILFSSKRSAVE